MNQCRLDKPRDLRLILGVLIIFGVTIIGFLSFFNHIHNSRFGDDFSAHFLIGLGESLNYSNAPPHWLFFQLVRESYHASDSRVFAYNVFIGMTAVATMFKYVFFVFHKGLNFDSKRESWLELKRHLLAIGLLFCTVVPVVTGFGEGMFLGYINPTCWRNPTTIVSIPLAILLFYGTVQLIEKVKTGWYWVVLLILLEVVLIQVKPSYMLAYLPSISLVAFVFFLSRRVDRKELMKYFLIALVGTLALVERKISHGDSGVGGVLQALPFKVWLNFVGNSPIKLAAALISSLALPFVYLVECKWKKQKVGMMFVFAFLVLGVAIFQYLFVAEVGHLTFYRNLIWQSMVASTIIHMVIVQESYDRKNVYTLGYFAIMVFVGLNWFRLLALG